MTRRQEAVRAIWLAFLVITWVTAAFLMYRASKMTPAYNYPAGAGTPLLLAAAALTAAPFAVVLPSLIMAIIRGERAYSAWKASLTPQQRMALELAETAAVLAAWREARREHKIRDEKLTASVMGLTKPDGITPRHAHMSPSQLAMLQAHYRKLDQLEHRHR